jgi:hypothetical protein
MIMFDHKTKADIDQYLFSLNQLTTGKNPAVPKKDVSVDPLVH